jgi:hypothetical protein
MMRTSGSNTASTDPTVRRNRRCRAAGLARH